MRGKISLLVFLDNFISEDLDTFLTGSERESDAGGCAKTTCKRGEIAVNSPAFINYGQRRCKAVTSVRKTARGRLFRHEPCQGDTPAPSQPQARRAADRDPAGGGTPVRRPSQPPSKSFALTPGEVVSNAGEEMRLYRKVLISEAPGINSSRISPANPAERIAGEGSEILRPAELSPQGGSKAVRRISEPGPCFCGIKQTQ